MLITPRAHRLTLLLVLALCAPLAARADEASHRAKAQEMMALLHTERMVQQISENIRKQIADAGQNVIGAEPTPEKKAKLDEFTKHASEAIDAQLGWTSMQSGFTDIYMKTFTEEQLDAIIAFYKSPAGVALLEKMPTVNAEVTQLGQARLATLQPQLKQLYDDLQKSQAAPPPTLGPTPPGSSTPAAPAAPATRATPPASSPK
jgi:uncharacterized protein